MWIHYFLVMPDHIHALISFAYNPDLQHTVSEWKRYTSRKYNINWQRDFFDHRLINDESYLKKENYIALNPVRAGLVSEPEEWLYSWSSRSERTAV